MKVKTKKSLEKEIKKLQVNLDNFLVKCKNAGITKEEISTVIDDHFLLRVLEVEKLQNDHDELQRKYNALLKTSGRNYMEKNNVEVS